MPRLKKPLSASERVASREEILGLSANTISAIERNEENATLQTLNQILRRFGMEFTIRPRR